MSPGGGVDGPIWSIGAGHMGGAILRRWLETGLDPAQLTVIRRSDAAFAPGVATMTSIPADGPRPALVLLGVKPQMLPAVAAPLAAALAPGTILLSILAGVDAGTLARLFPQARIVRSMPNLPVAIGRGVVAVHLGEPDAGLRAMIDGLMAPLGLVEWIADEAQMDIVTALAGSGPAYLYRFIDALAAAGVAAGLPAAQAARLALATIAGAGDQARDSGIAPAEMARRVASPGGSTQKGLDRLDADGALNTLMQDTIAAAIARNREMAAAAAG